MVEGEDLLGAKPRKPAKARKASAADGRVPALEAAFVEKHKGRWKGVAPMIKFGRERRHLKELAAALTDAEILLLMDVFFATREPEVERSDYTISSFYRLVPRLRLVEHRLAERRNADRRTRENVDAAARATGRNTR